jgi:hypothetical protein
MIGSQLLRPFSSSYSNSFSSTWLESSGKLHHHFQSPRTICRESSVVVDVLSTEDIVVGTVLALALAFTASFLQSRRSQNDFVLWEKNSVEDLADTKSPEENVVFDAEEWREMSRPDNYILYNRKLNEREKNRKSSQSVRSENFWVIIALLTLFVPIFSVEFFFALSRQVVCGGNPMDQVEWAEYLCSPAILDGGN